MVNLNGAYDIVVIGGGPIGLATAYECVKAGKKVLLLEQSTFFNQSGSSADFVRMFRTAYTEDFMADLAYESMPLWDNLELTLGTPLRAMSGLLNFGDPEYGAGGPEGTLLDPIKNLDRLGLPYEILDRDQIEARHPFQNLPDNWLAVDMAENNGVINVPLLMRTLFARIKELGVHLLQYAAVKKLIPDSQNQDGWLVEGELSTDRGSSIPPENFSFATKKVAVTCGAFVNHVLYPSFGFSFDLDIWELTFSYFAIDQDVVFPRMWFQFAEDKPAVPGGKPGALSNLFYGFPPVPWGPPNTSRIAVDAATQVIKDPNERSHSRIEPADIENTRQFCIQHVRGVGPDPVPVFSTEGLQTNVFDNMFVLDTIPDYLIPNAGAARSKSIAVFTAGWAMKFVPLIGKVMKELLVDGTTSHDISHFKMDRHDGDDHIIVQGAAKGSKVSTRFAGSSIRV